MTWLFILCFRKELLKIKEELRVKTLQLLDEKSRTSTQDSKIIQIEAEKDKLRSHNMNIAMKLEELKLKYDPGNPFHSNGFSHTCY